MRYLASLISSPWAILESYLPLVSSVLTRLARGESMSHADEVAVAGGPRAFAARRQEGAQYAGKGGAVAVVPVYGVLLQRGDFTDLSEPATSMTRLANTIRALASDDAISAIVLDIDSPGGTVYGTEELAQTVYDARSAKPIIGVANSLAASAAYWIGSQCGELYAAPGAEVGSIGVYTAHTDVSKALEQDGIAVTLISAGKHKTEANPYEPLGTEARAHVQSTVDAYHDSFVAAVARGRGTSQKAARTEMGEGRVLLPDAAKAARMIDGVATLGQVVAKLQARPRGAVAYSIGSPGATAELERMRAGTAGGSPASSRRAAMAAELAALSR